ncbi:unnamed protein product, partial [Mesorhabditis spiculigera]
MKLVIVALVAVAAAQNAEPNVWDPPRGLAFPPLAEWNLDSNCFSCLDVAAVTEKFGSDGFQCSAPPGQNVDCNACCAEKTLHLGLMWPQPVVGFPILSMSDNQPACACCFNKGQCDIPMPGQQQ